ncbi:glycosyltransferase family 1 protein [Neobacillus sp. PS3-40]|uniref:glycosyltransferase family 1 protein n=1 Tax=Neobacillus sp. PS3-40 TaxID=3070679 RepID=UPI0027E165CF|nr:glycosyltransferase family 1 protein [Neobacillus sp. PS3-40]WML45827.1 glycosyltransferase family 1 protein [Neobacillus sp. PS3-40]
MGCPLRILHVVVNMNRGGAETLIMNLYRNIDRTKVQFDFLTCKEGAFDAEIKKMGGKVHRIPYISDVGHFKYIKELNKFFTLQNHYKVVHSHLDKMSGLVLRSAKKAGIPTRIAHSHNTSSEGGAAAKMYKWYAGQHILPSATNLFACSKEAAQWLFKEKSNSSNILKNGIESNRFEFSQEIRQQVREEFQLDHNTFVLGHVGRFNHQKNHSFLIDIFNQFNKVYKNSILILVGDGHLRSEMEKKAKDLNLKEKIKFIGIREDINLILQAFDVFIFPSLHEGLPVSLIEAQGAGLPCVISNKISKDVDLSINLIEFSPLGDIQLWVDKIIKIATKKNSRKTVPNSLSKQGYDIKTIASSIENFYLRVSG